MSRCLHTSPGSSESAVLGGDQGHLCFQQVPQTALNPSLAGTPRLSSLKSLLARTVESLKMSSTDC